MNRLVSKSVADTNRIAHQVYGKIKGQIGKKALVIALSGELGSGKTTFTKKLAKLMGLKDTVLSPTFILHDEYDRLDHIDLWRIESPQELIDLGLGKMVANKRVVVIEWAEKAKEQIQGFAHQATIVWIKFEHGKSDNERKVSFENISHMRS